ncbi:hypothetical protein PG987_006394 [Apiospora arundinis]
MVPHQAQYTKHHGFEGVAEIRRLDAHLPILDPELHVICHAADGDAEGLFGTDSTDATENVRFACPGGRVLCASVTSYVHHL